VTDAGEPRDRHAYLEEQIARQQRGEPVDVEWVRAELERVRREQLQTLSRTRKRLLAVTLVSALLLVVLWIRRGGLQQQNGVLIACVLLVALLGAFSLRRRR
jgi:hypothetical protein